VAKKLRATWKRRLVRATILIVILLVAGVAFLPQILGTRPGRTFVLARVNQAIAPGRLEAKDLRFSWSGPIRAEGVVLRTGEGKAVVSAPSAVWDRGLWRLLTDRPRYGTITLVGASCDITRREDGSIDLVDALGLGPKKGTPEPTKPVQQAATSKPAMATLKIVDGSLLLHSPELPAGFTAERLDMTLDQPAPPASPSFDVRLARPGGETLTITGQLDATSMPTVALAANRWPLDLALSGLTGRAILDGTAAIDLRGGAVAASGDITLARVEAAGPALGGDRVRLDQIAGAWDLARSEAGWTIRRLDLASPIASLRSNRAIPAPPGESATITGRFDLAALAKQAPHALRLRDGLDLRSGAAEVRVDVREDAGTQRLAVTAKLSDIEARDRDRPAPIVLRSPATLTAAVAATGRDVRVDRLGLTAAGLTLEGSGDLARGVMVSGRFDLAAMQEQARDLVDLQGMELAGSGGVRADYRRSDGGYLARYKAQVDGFSLSRLGASPIAREVVKLEGDVSGAADVTGLPTSWRVTRIGLGLPEMAASITLSSRADGLAITAAASRPMVLDGRPAQAEVRGVALWSGTSIELGEFLARIIPAAPAEAISLSATGRYDVAAGILTLAPVAGGSIAVAPSGFRLGGLGSGSTSLIIDGGFVGDLKAVDRLWALYSGTAPFGLDGPCGLALRAAYEAQSGRLNVAALTATSRYGSTAVSGKIDDLTGLLNADLGGVLTIDKATLDALVASAIAPDARVSARVRPFHIRGPLSGDVIRGIDVEGGLEIDGAEAAGMKLGPARVVAKLSGGKVAIEPIRSTLNGGVVEIVSSVTLEEPGGATVHLLPGTAIRGAMIDKQLSDRLLSYVAPILHEASQVRGQLSMVMDRADFPIGGPVERPVSLAGSIEFKDVLFSPGPAAVEVMSVVSLKHEARLRLNETIRVAVVKGRVYQQGLSIPVGGGESLGLDGSVGFDGSLALKATVPLSLVGGAPRGAAGDAGTLHVPVPIGGTVAKPRIDRQALAKALREEGRSALRREAESGANDLIRRLGAEVKPRR
jgi:translocation and assembly module TamB